MTKVPSKIIEIFQYLDEVTEKAVGRPELLEFVETVHGLFEQSKQALEESSKRSSSEVKDAARQLRQEMAGAVDELRRLAGDVDAKGTQSLTKAIQSLQGALQEVRGEITPPFDPSYLEEELDELRKRVPPTFDPSGLEDEIEDLREDIEELRDAIEEAKRITTPRRVGSIFGGRVTHVPMTDTFTGDGVTKTFYLSKAPRDLATVTAFCTDFPSVMVNERGFTISGKAVTLEASVDAPSVNARLVINFYV